MPKTTRASVQSQVEVHGRAGQKVRQLWTRQAIDKRREEDGGRHNYLGPIPPLTAPGTAEGTLGGGVQQYPAASNPLVEMFSFIRTDPVVWTLVTSRPSL